MGSGREGKTVWSWFALRYEALPPTPRWWLEGKQRGISVHMKSRQGKIPIPLVICLWKEGPNWWTGLTYKTTTVQGPGSSWEIGQLLAPLLERTPPSDSTENSLSVGAPIENAASLPSTSKEKMEGCWANVPVFQRSLQERGKYPTSDEQPLIRLRAEGEKKNHIVCLKLSCKWFAASQYIQPPFSQELFERWRLFMKWTLLGGVL